MLSSPFLEVISYDFLSVKLFNSEKTGLLQF